MFLASSQFSVDAYPAEAPGRRGHFEFSFRVPPRSCVCFENGFSEVQQGSELQAGQSQIGLHLLLMDRQDPLPPSQPMILECAIESPMNDTKGMKFNALGEIRSIHLVHPMGEGKSA